MKRPPEPPLTPVKIHKLSNEEALPVLILFSLAMFLGAALLFMVEPMFGKMALPLLGGTPAVWNTCMVFYQGALLGRISLCAPGA